MGQFLLNVPYETSISDPPDYAGARVIRMIERSLGGTPPDVTAVYQHATALNAGGENWPGWYIDPGAMKRTLIDFDPRGGSHFVVYPSAYQVQQGLGADQKRADDQVRATLDIYKVAEANLVSAGKHWVCVIGYTTDSNNKYNGFIINDPAYDGGGAQLVVSLTDWDNAYTPVGGGVQWVNQIVEVGDPREVKTEFERAPRRIVMPGDRLITPEEVTKLALDGVRTQFGDVPHLRRAIVDGRPGTPRLVARLDVPGSYYYIVPLQASANDASQVIGAVTVDARFGDVLSASAAAQPFRLWPIRAEQVREIVTRQPIPIYASPDAVASRLADLTSVSPWHAAPVMAWHAQMHGQQPTEMRSRQVVAQSSRELIAAAIGSAREPIDHAVLRAGEFDVSSISYWAPCISPTPFYPAYQIRTPWHSFYVSSATGVIASHLSLWCWTPLGA